MNDMLIVTDMGNFGSFKDVKTCMRIEHLDVIQIYSVNYWGIDVPSKGTYTADQIDFILTNDPMDDPDYWPPETDDFDNWLYSMACG